MMKGRNMTYYNRFDNRDGDYEPVPEEVMYIATHLKSGESKSIKDGTEYSGGTLWSVVKRGSRTEIIRGGINSGRVVKTISDPAVNNPCFVATAVYQNSFTDEVDLYRWFRDNYLMNSRLGKRFVERYYSGLGANLADFIEANPFLRKPCKVALDLGAIVISCLKGAD